VQLDGIARSNAGVGLDDSVSIRKRACAPARQVVVSPTSVNPTERDMRYIGTLLDGLPVTQGDELRVALFGRGTAGFRVQRTTPAGPVIIGPATELVVEGP